MANDPFHLRADEAHDHAGHGHGHEDGHAHAHLPDARAVSRMLPEERAKERRSLLATLILVTVIMVLEWVGGWLTGSLALRADAGHMLTDSVAIVLSLLAISFASRPADRKRSFGFYRMEILAALANGVALVVLAAWIIYEAVDRFRSPEPIDAVPMIAIAAIGLVANIVALFMLHRKNGSLNIRGAYLHVVGDTLSSVGVIVAALIILLTGWTPIDPILSIGIALVIVWSGLRLVREAVDVLLEAVPAHLDLAEVLHEMERADGVARVHDLHIWTISSGMHSLSAHVVVEGCDMGRNEEILRSLRSLLAEKFDLDHVTLQLETPAHCHGLDLH
ncbi:cation diffusion facilitator family transporter [Vulgatibacter incomptus]|uniref:Cobalt-zinc-cadmium resistance protein CzcD n=1 Tax=Vulgatibacter incomptus TaxID=1391653 RepID=A0A0K1PBI2_9BACT|nr:cation diffusion facilitator family transporter [Vulgatibacter incomptus]AKU90484.1 Cobalt-zinc-cadmium resistance protein CzcD [Vulgatibacter incomptus]